MRWFHPDFQSSMEVSCGQKKINTLKLPAATMMPKVENNVDGLHQLREMALNIAHQGCA